MTSRTPLIVLAAAAGALCLAACETTDTYGAGASTSASSADSTPLKRACRPGDTAAGTRSGLACDSGSSTGTPAGSDANVKGAASTGAAPAVPGRE
jgi:hypothetical protein